MSLSKRGLLIIIALSVILIPICSAIDLEISSSPVRDSVINNQNVPAIFKIEIKNNGNSANFEIFTFEKFEITPSKFRIEKGQTKTIDFEFLPIESMRNNKGSVIVPFFIKEETGGHTEEGRVVVRLVEVEQTFAINAESINPDSKEIIMYFYNLENITYKDVKVTFSSSFFNDELKTLNLYPHEKQQVIIPINLEKLKKLLSGAYTIRASYTYEDEAGVTETPIKFLEKSDVSSSKSQSGIIIRKTKIKKINEGNIPVIVEANVKKNIISRLFSSFSPAPSDVKRNGFIVDYSWKTELAPGELLDVEVITNWLFPLILIIAIAIIAYLSDMYFTTNLVIKKKVNFVKTKSNYFALKVTLKVKAKKFLENVRIYDQLPAMSQLYEKFGTMPDKIDRQTGRLSWNIKRFTEGEERVYTYIIYSKMKVIGKFELPAATGVYETNGKVHESKSNKAFFLNEPHEHRKLEFGK
ncbi:MAG: hypothetical protein WC533_02305 [Candidatus Pacearchaeota archaeon]